jgi:hypothetical protein
MNAMIHQTPAVQAKNWRFNPLTNLQPATLSRHLDAFEAGHLREAALIWEALEQRDDLLRTVISKRKKSVARHGWTVLPLPNLTGAEKSRAQEHAAALEHFYSHLECEHAVDTAERGGFKLLARQMMDAVGKRFAVHEIIWRDAEGSADIGGTATTAGGTHRNFVEAKFRFVPLPFFENTTGRLRFLEQDFAQEGRELEPGAWMVTVGDGLMVASSTAWMFKHLSLDDWLRCSSRNGIPALRGISAAARGSAEWTALEESLAGVLEGQSIIHSSSDSVEVLDLMAGGNIPFPQLVERIDRMLAALWRGADLSTISRDRGYGASLQEKETCALEEDDAEMLTETLNRYVDEWVIRHVFGAEEKPLAHVQVLVTPRECTSGDLQVDEFLLRHGAPLSLQEAMNRYGRALPKPGEPVLLAGTSKASLPESSQNLGMAEEMENQGLGCGPTVSFRGCSPSTLTPNLTLNPPNVSEEEPTRAPGLALENQFTLLQDDWLQLSPYGDFPHARGLQRVDRAAAQAMVAQFSSFRGRLGRLFGGVPFFVGHPDLPGAGEMADRKAYGWITEVEAREDGLYGRVKWSDAGLELLRNAHYKFYSPYWEAREIGSEKGRRVYQPVALLSVGLTNQPNIPVRPLANDTGSGESCADWQSAPHEALCSADNPVCESAGSGDFQSAQIPGPCGADCQSAQLTGSQTTAPQPTQEPAEPNASALCLGASVAPPRLANRLPMHTVSCTEGLARRKAELVRLPNRRDRIQECVLSKMRLGLSYDQAWEHVKREHAGWFQEGAQ